MFAQTVLFGISMLLIKSSNAEYNVEKYCQLIQSGTKLASSESCQSYYTCLDNGMAVKYTCPDNYAFNKNAQSCVPASESNCYVGLSNPCQNKNNAFAYCSKGCNWYNYCVDGQIVANGTCASGERFYPANGTCIYGECDASDSDMVVDPCDIMPDGAYFGDFDNCHAWHKCSAVRVEHGVCESGLVFDVTSGFCLPNNGNMCQRTHNVVQSQASGPPQEACTSANQVAADTDVCSIYYICQRNTQTPAPTYEWVQRRCKNQYFDVISQQCTYHTNARVYPGCDRCELTGSHTSTYWANAVDPSCQKYYTCQNGRKIGTKLGSCEEDYFFDEVAQYCIEGEDVKEQYKTHNGACQDYACNDLRECSLSA